MLSGGRGGRQPQMSTTARIWRLHRRVSPALHSSGFQQFTNPRKREYEPLKGREKKTAQSKGAGNLSGQSMFFKYFPNTETAYTFTGISV